MEAFRPAFGIWFFLQNILRLRLLFNGEVNSPCNNLTAGICRAGSRRHTNAFSVESKLLSFQVQINCLNFIWNWNGTCPTGAAGFARSRRRLPAALQIQWKIGTNQT
jgi:hypothetical protein